MGYKSYYERFEERIGNIYKLLEEIENSEKGKGMRIPDMQAAMLLLQGISAELLLDIAKNLDRQYRES